MWGTRYFGQLRVSDNSNGTACAYYLLLTVCDIHITTYRVRTQVQVRESRQQVLGGGGTLEGVMKFTSMLWFRPSHGIRKYKKNKLRKRNTNKVRLQAEVPRHQSVSAHSAPGSHRCDGYELIFMKEVQIFSNYT